MEQLVHDSMAFISNRWIRMLVTLTSAIFSQWSGADAQSGPLLLPWPFQSYTSAVSVTLCFSAPRTHDDSPLVLWESVVGWSVM